MMQNPWTKAEIEIAVELAKKGLRASEIAAELKGRTRNAVVGLLHRRKIMMSIFQNKPYPTKLPSATPKPRRKKTPTGSLVAGISLAPVTTDRVAVNVEKLFEQKDENVVYGKVSLLDAHRTQCKYILDTPMVCGDPVVNNSSWCKHHYGVVFTPYSVARAAAIELKKRRELEKWPERRKF